MPQFQVTFTRENDTSDGSAPQSSITSSQTAATRDGAIAKADTYFTEMGRFHGDREDWTAKAVNLETDD